LEAVELEVVILQQLVLLVGQTVNQLVELEVVETELSTLVVYHAHHHLS
jgi:hypothetical protein